jgi:hypothetical protein
METVVVLVIACAAALAVVLPLVRPGDPARDRTFFDPTADSPAPAALADLPSLERDIQRYRKALRHGTVCSRCGQANPEGSRFCYECGRRLRAVAARPKRAMAGAAK